MSSHLRFFRVISNTWGFFLVFAGPGWTAEVPWVPSSLTIKPFARWKKDLKKKASTLDTSKYSGGWRTWISSHKNCSPIYFGKAFPKSWKLFYRKKLTRKSSISDFARILLQKTTSTSGSSFCWSTCGVPSIFETLLWKEPSLLHAKLIVVPPVISKPSRLISLSNRSCLCV